MARTVAALPAGRRITDYISLGVVAKTFPLDKICSVLVATRKQSVRQRDLPAHVVVYYVIALALYMQSSYREVLRCLLEGIQWLAEPSAGIHVAGNSGISQARTRLGWEPLRDLHDELVKPVAVAATKGAWYGSWRLVSLDGSTLDVADERGNSQAFGRPGARRNTSAYPQIRFVVRIIEYELKGVEGAEPLYRLATTILDHEPAPAGELAALYHERWEIGVSSQGHIVQSVRDRPRLKDSGLVAGEASWRESKTTEPSDNILRKECAQRTRLQRAVNADVASLHESPVAETVDNARKQQGLAETSPMRQLSPAGYQRRHGVKEDVETGEALGARRRNLVEEMPAITVSGKCRHRRQGDGSGRSTADGRAAKRARREGPGPVSTSLTKGRQG